MNLLFFIVVVVVVVIVVAILLDWYTKNDTLITSSVA